MAGLGSAPAGGATLLAPDRLDAAGAEGLLHRLFPALPQGVEWNLRRTEEALASLGDPQSAFRTVHVGGTNGKGSVTATVASVLRESGRRAAAYTSPHLVSFRERLIVDGEAIPEEVLVRYAHDVRDAIVRFGLTFFEAATVLAFHAFREEGVEVAAVEVGLGGRLDATNVLRPEVAAVTNVAMDHMEYLGSSLQEIAGEKAGIMKAGVPFVTAEADPRILSLFRVRGRALGAPVSAVDSGAVRDVRVAPDHTSFRLATSAWGEVEVVTPLVGRHQAVNTALAVAICEHLSPELRPDARGLLAGIRAVRHRGRDELRVIDGRTWLFDVAHNAAGVESLADTLDTIDLPRPRVLLVGVLRDKDWRAMLPPLLARADAAVLTVPATAPSERRWDPEAAARALEADLLAGGEGRAGAPAVVAAPEFSDALRLAEARAGAGTLVVTGSVHTVGNAMAALGIDPLG